MVPQSREREHQGGHPLLTIDDEPALHPARGDALGRQHDRTEEVTRAGTPFLPVLDQLLHVAPQLLQLVALPAVGALVERYLELLLPLDQLAERGLLSVHARPLPKP